MEWLWLCLTTVVARLSSEPLSLEPSSAWSDPTPAVEEVDPRDLCGEPCLASTASEASSSPPTPLPVRRRNPNRCIAGRAAGERRPRRG